jgi:aminopeptidase N
MRAVLDEYRSDLSHEVNGKTIESAGPVDFSMRLETNSGALARHVIVYEKGTWIIHMLRERLGSDAFLELETRLLHDFAARPISNDEFRATAATYLAARDIDKGLETFFDTWVYGTGIPTLRMNRRGRDYSIDVSGVDEDFTVDVPLRCATKEGRHETRRVRVTSGNTPMSIPASISACQLPSTTEFLYTP